MSIIDGPVEFTVSGEEREQVQQEALEYSEFADEHPELFKRTHVEQQRKGDEQPTRQSPDPQLGETEASDELVELAQQCGVTVGQFAKLVAIPEEDDEVPYLNLYKLPDGADTIDNSRNGRQARASIALLSVWRECLNTNTVEIDALEKALNYSEISTERLDHMYEALSGDANNFFERGNGEVSLTPPGRRAGREELTRLVEMMEDE